MFDAINSKDKAVAKWLLICCGLVFAMVVLGGFTRLTGSGLSMVDWQPVKGILPPLTDQAWQETFEMYQATPEFQKVNSSMDVNDFKGIFWLEYLHRLLGRLIGIVFLVPFLVFAWRGYIRRDEWLKYTAMFVLGGNIRGGQVLAEWPGLEREQLYEGQDLEITIDYRDVLMEILGRRAGNTDYEAVFPDPSYSPVNWGVTR